MFVSIAFKKRRRDWILRNFSFNKKNTLGLSLILILEIFEAQSRQAGPKKVMKTFGIPQILRRVSVSKKMSRFCKPPFFLIYVLDNISHNLLDQPRSPYYQCSLQASETVSLRKPWCCYSTNMLQH